MWLSLPWVMLRSSSPSSRAFGELRLTARIEHADDAADNFKMAKLFGCNIEKEIFATRIAFG